MGSTKTPVIYFCRRVLVRSLLIVASLICVVSVLSTRRSEDWEDDTSYYGTFLSSFSTPLFFIYFVVVFSVAGLYTIIIKLSSCLVICLAPASPTMLLLFAFFDVLILGIIASATGTAGSVAYILPRGNDDFSRSDFCSAYSSLGVSILASIFCSSCFWTFIITLYKRISEQTYSRNTSASAGPPPPSPAAPQT